jgi:hypothetical protein
VAKFVTHLEAIGTTALAANRRGTHEAWTPFACGAATAFVHLAITVIVQPVATALFAAKLSDPTIIRSTRVGQRVVIGQQRVGPAIHLFTVGKAITVRVGLGAACSGAPFGIVVEAIIVAIQVTTVGHSIAVSIDQDLVFRGSFFLRAILCTEAFHPVAPAVAVTIVIAIRTTTVSVDVGRQLVTVEQTVVIGVSVLIIEDAITVGISGVSRIAADFDAVGHAITVVIDILPVLQAVAINIGSSLGAVVNAVAISVEIAEVRLAIAIGIGQDVFARRWPSLFEVGNAITIAVAILHIRTAVTVGVDSPSPFHLVGDTVTISISKAGYIALHVAFGHARTAAFGFRTASPAKDEQHMGYTQ